MYNFEKISVNSQIWDEYDDFPGKSVLTTKEWLNFVSEDSGAELYLLRIIRNEETIGFFSSLIIKKMGVKVVGSPFPGWSTPYMGMDIVNPVEKVGILPHLIAFIFQDTQCSFFVISDRDITNENEISIPRNLHYKIHKNETLELKIDGDDAFLYKNMKTDCRNFIKQFERRGAVIEQAIPNDEFAEEFYHQLIDVFAKQKLVPTYTVDKVKCLLKHLSKTNSVLCLRVRNPEGDSIATSIFPAFNKKMFFWGGASLREFQHYRPNEYMIYTAMRYWRDRGCVDFDMMGNRSYKKKFGSWVVEYPCIEVSSIKGLISLKQLASKLYYLSGSLLWKMNINR